MVLAEWLKRIKSLHSKEIDLSLERTAQVAEKMGLLQPICPVVTVAGTNGKGSCVAGIEAIAMAAGYKVGAFTTPFLLRYNEQVRLQGKPVTDFQLCEAFEGTAEACGEITLTPFEFGTLAALVIFKKANLDLWILEVGMGGRWDAVNILSADIALITSIAIDHVEWLGQTRDAIGYQKAGIFRRHKPAIYGDFQPPQSILDYATTLETPLFIQGQQFNFVEKETTWDWWSEQTRLDHLPLPSLILQNVSTVLMAIELLQKKLPMPRRAIDLALTKVTLPGRIQVIPGDISHILDVSHNPAAVEQLAWYLRRNPCTGKTYAVFSMLGDKDIVEAIRAIQDAIDYWYVAPLATERAASEAVLTYAFRKLKIKNVNFYSSITTAAEAAEQRATRDVKNSSQGTGNRVIVFGSFHTVSEFNGILLKGAPLLSEVIQ